MGLLNKICINVNRRGGCATIQLKTTGAAYWGFGGRGHVLTNGQSVVNTWPKTLPGIWPLLSASNWRRCVRFLTPKTPTKQVWLSHDLSCLTSTTHIWRGFELLMNIFHWIKHDLWLWEMNGSTGSWLSFFFANFYGTVYNCVCVWRGGGILN